MARTIKEIKKQMTDAFMADADIRDMYGFKEGDTFEGSFSAVSLESILMYIVFNGIGRRRWNISTAMLYIGTP